MTLEPEATVLLLKLVSGLIDCDIKLYENFFQQTDSIVGSRRGIVGFNILCMVDTVHTRSLCINYVYNYRDQLPRLRQCTLMCFFITMSFINQFAIILDVLCCCMFPKLCKIIKFVVINFSAFDTVISNMHLLVISSKRSFC